MMSPPTAAISSSSPAWRCRLNRRWESSTWKWWQTRAFTTAAKSQPVSKPASRPTSPSLGPPRISSGGCSPSRILSTTRRAIAIAVRAPSGWNTAAPRPTAAARSNTTPPMHAPSCELRPRCTEAKGPRRIKRLVNDEDALERMAARVAAQPDKLAQRKALIERPFGTLKRSWNHGYFLLRTLPKVTTEFSLSVLTYNLRRALKLIL